MSSDKHRHSIHIDAPVEKVFGYLEDPGHFLASFLEKNQVTLESVNRNPDGTVATYQSRFRQAGMHFTVTYTREEYVPNERIVDRNSIGVLFTWSVEPDADGTKLTMSWDASRLMTMLDAVFFHTDKKEADEMLERVRQAVEALP
jgi:uncharacterized protein YndB with AHSA1/START domain